MRPAIVLILAATLQGQDHWAAQLATDVKAGSWDAAERVGSALMGEIEAGRIFSRFSDVPAEAAVRRLYAEALDHLGRKDEARRQREIADHPDAVVHEYGARLANLKRDLLATQINEPSSFGGANQVRIAFFRADWCAPCKQERARLKNYRNSSAKMIEFDVDHLDSSFRKYVPLES